LRPALNAAVSPVLSFRNAARHQRHASGNARHHRLGQTQDADAGGLPPLAG